MYFAAVVKFVRVDLGSIVRMVLVDGIVRQVLVLVILVRCRWFLVLFRRKPDQSVFIDVETKRIAADNENVDSQVEFEALVDEGSRCNDVSTSRCILGPPASQMGARRRPKS